MRSDTDLPRDTGPSVTTLAANVDDPRIEHTPISDPPVTGSAGKKERRQKSVVRAAVVRFVASSMVLLLVLIVAIVILADRIATQEALRDARVRGSSIGNLLAAPLVNAKVRRHVPGASTELATVLHNRMSDGSVLHVKVWDKDGTVIWSDEKRYEGQRFPLADGVKELFGTRGTIAQITDLSTAEDKNRSQSPTQQNLGGQNPGEVLEVYAGARDADRQPMVFEASFSSSGMRADERAIIYGFLPIVIAALLLFQVALLPMAMSLARRVEKGLAERSSLMRHALLATDLERRRLAQDLHDGVIQDLSGLSYAMPLLDAHFANNPATPAVRQTSRKVSEILRRDVAALRSMITDIYPRDLNGPGFAASIEDLARGAREHGVQVQVEMAPQLSIPVDTALLAYRVVREGLRNTAKHAQATTARVEVRCDSDRVIVTVSDDGQGVRGGPVEEGHLGLRLLEDTMHDLGGQMSLRSGASGGAVLEASFPLVIVQY